MRLLLMLCLFLPAALSGQDSLARPDIPRLTIKTNPLTVMNYFKPSASLHLDLRLSRRFGLDLGAGAIFDSSIFADHKGESYRGPRFRAGLKYYHQIEESAAFHVGIAAKYNDVTHMFFRRALRQGGRYEEILLNKRKVKSYGAALQYGVQLYLGDDRRLLLEPYAGFGVSWNKVSISLPPDAELLRDRRFFTFEFPEGTSPWFDILLGFHIGYVLW
jgi:hypothetical protein